MSSFTSPAPIPNSERTASQWEISLRRAHASLAQSELNFQLAILEARAYMDELEFQEVTRTLTGFSPFWSPRFIKAD